VLVERYVFHEDLGKPGGERLLAWCRSLGADSFTFTVIGTPPALERLAAVIEAPLASFRISPAKLRTQVDVLRELNDTTEAYLLKCFPHGLLTYAPARGIAWCENPCLFRADEMMLGVISHEDAGVLCIEAREQLTLDQSELPYRLEGLRLS
jgi:hypothetical protein